MFFTLLPAKKPKSQQMLTKLFLQVDDTLNTPQPRGFVFKSITDWKNEFLWPYWVTRAFERTAFIFLNSKIGLKMKIEGFTKNSWLNQKMVLLGEASL